MTKPQLTTKLVSTEKNQAVVEATIPAALVSHHRQESVKHLATGVTIKGFRKGKAPLDLVEQQLDPQKITEHTLRHVVPDAVSTSVTQHQLKVIGSPHLKIKDAKPNQDWTFEITFPLSPNIKLGDYKTAIKQVNSTSTIWTPDKDQPAPRPEDKEADQLNKIFDKLLETITFDVPQVLIDEEVNQSLSRLISQTEKLGLKIDDYLKTLGKKPEQLKADYEKAAHDNLRLELILEAIAADLNIDVEQKEVEALIQATATQDAKDKLDTPSQHQYIKAILRKRKTIDALLKL